MRGRFVELGTLTAHGLAKRRVRAYVPRHASDAARPVLFMFDGQNVFTDAGSFAGGWHVHDVVEKLARTRRAAMPIVVAIDHGGTARIDELAPFRDATYGGGKLQVLIDALVTTLVPRVDAHFGATTAVDDLETGHCARILIGVLHARCEGRFTKRAAHDLLDDGTVEYRGLFVKPRS